MNKPKIKQYANYRLIQPDNKFKHFLTLGAPYGLEISLAQMVKKLRDENGNRVGNAGLLFSVNSSGTHAVATHSRGGRKPIKQETAIFKGLTAKFPKRVACTEFQLLNMFEQRSRKIVNKKFWIILYTEKAPCISCEEVIQQFLMHFPRVRLRILYSKGNWRWVAGAREWGERVRKRCAARKIKANKINLWNDATWENYTIEVSFSSFLKARLLKILLYLGCTKSLNNQSK